MTREVELVSLRSLARMGCVALVSVGLAVLASFSASRASAAVLFETQELLASDGASGDSFGFSVSLSGSVAVVGARFDDDGGSNAGAAYVYRYDGSSWVEEQKLTASDAAALDSFGGSVSVSGDVAVVGATGDDDAGSNSGAAYVYRYDGSSWVEEQKLTASDAAGGDRFGQVAVSGDVIVVGATGDDDDGSGSGSAYVYRFDGSSWVEEQKLTASDAAALDAFGSSVAASGEVVVVGAPDEDAGGSNAGAAYVYRYDGSSWVEEQKLLASDGGAEEAFGEVAVSGDVVLVGAVGIGNNVGGAYVYRYDGSSWVEEQKLTASDGVDGDNFGIAVAVSGDAAVVGAFGDDDTGANSGSAYRYHYDGSSWVEEDKLLASDGGSGDAFGRSTSISGDVSLVGAPGHADNGAGSGAAYVYGAPVVVVPVQVDIRPGSIINPINLMSSGLIPVAILGSASFDVNDVDVTTLAFGPAGAAPFHPQGGHLQDVNGDGYTDLLSHYETMDTGIAAGDTEACVKGELLDATPILGCDQIVTSPACGLGFELVFLMPVLMAAYRRRRA